MDMATAFSTTSVLSWRNPQCMHNPLPSHTRCHSSVQDGILRTVAASGSKENCLVDGKTEKCPSLLVNRRAVLASGVSLLCFPGESLAVVKQRSSSRENSWPV
uniref:Uncharacterized protein n=1 Tax=Lotus japonicus TaxID=34305 RepID=I3T924_LOTJA|nr:unknown [Lotus japonicus]